MCEQCRSINTELKDPSAVHEIGHLLRRRIGSGTGEGNKGDFLCIFNVVFYKSEANMIKGYLFCGDKFLDLNLFILLFCVKF